MTSYAVWAAAAAAPLWALIGTPARSASCTQCTARRTNGPAYAQIADTLRGTPPLRLTDAQEDGLRDAFDRAVHSLQAIGLAECIDLLRTEWVALRLLRLFGYPAHVVDQLATLFPRSRDDDPFYRDTWARICADNGWHCDLAVSDSSGSETAGS